VRIHVPDPQSARPATGAGGGDDEHPLELVLIQLLKPSFPRLLHGLVSRLDVAVGAIWVLDPSM
jgi:hypothetical protein